MARPSKPHENKGYWRVRIDGKEHHLGRDRRKAMAAFHRLMADRFVTPSADRPHTIAGTCEAWLELNESEWHVWRMRDFIGYAGAVNLQDVLPDLLTRYAVHLRRKRKLAPKTVIDRVRIAAAVLRWAHENGWLARLPKTPKMKKPVRKARDIEAGRLQAAFDELPETAGRVLRFIVATGCRPIEACRLRWSHINFARAIIVQDEHKTAGATGRPRTIYLTPEAIDVLDELREEGSDGFVFLSRLGTPYTPAGLRSIAKRRGFTPYQLRHTFAQNASEIVPRDVLSKLLGHDDEATTCHYYEVRDKRAATAASTLGSPLRLVKRGKRVNKGGRGSRVA